MGAGRAREEEIIGPPSLKACSDSLKRKGSKKSDQSYRSNLQLTLACSVSTSSSSTSDAAIALSTSALDTSSATATPLIP